MASSLETYIPSTDLLKVATELFSATDDLCPHELYQQILYDLKHHHISGPLNVKLCVFDTGNDTVMYTLFLGERHGNPNVCPNATNSKDMICDIVLKYLRASARFVVPYEFFYWVMETSDREVLIKHFEHMHHDDRYDLGMLIRCASQNRSTNCIYEYPKGALSFLRMAAIFAKIIYVDYGEDSVPGLDRFLYNLIFTDARDDLVKDIPFEFPEDENQKKIFDVHKHVIPNLQSIYDNVHTFVTECENPEWNERFQKNIFCPFLKDVHLFIQKAPHIDKDQVYEQYVEVFVHTYDIVCVSRMIAVHARALKSGNTDAIFFTNVCGNRHLTISEDMIAKHMFPYKVPPFVATSEEGESCIKPRNPPSPSKTP